MSEAELQRLVEGMHDVAAVVEREADRIVAQLRRLRRAFEEAEAMVDG